MRLESTQKLYQKIAGEKIGGFTVPAFNIRTLTFDVAGALFRAAKKEKAGSFIVELAQSEMNYTNQSPADYVREVKEAAKEENFNGVLFFQGDHFKPSQGNLRELIKRSLEAGFYNIDIDGSSMGSLKENAAQTAVYNKFIREVEPKDITVSVGGEVSRIGGANSTREELEQFLQLYQNYFWGQSPKGDSPQISSQIIKIAVQTGTSHGGIVLPSGKLKDIEADFQTLKELSEVARTYGLAGAVQHGASTLEEKDFEKFSQTGACEIHLATIFQNIILDNGDFPEELIEKMYSWVRKNFKKKEEETEEQFLYKNRKRALGPFKKEILKIPQKNVKNICEELEEKFSMFFKKLNISETKYLVEEIYS